MLRSSLIRLAVSGLAALGLGVLLHAEVSQSPGALPAREGQATVTLRDGRVLITGGLIGQAPTRTAEIFDPATTTSVEIQPMIEARAYHTASLMADGRVLIAGGSSLEMFDPAGNAFLEVGPLVPARSAQAAAVLSDGRVLLAGGFSDSQALSRIDLFDPATGLVTPANASLSPARGSLSASTLPGGDVLLAGGNSGQSDVGVVEVYDPSSDSISAGPALQTPRSGQQATLLPDGTGVLIMGGRSNGMPAAAELLSLDSLHTGLASRRASSSDSTAALSPTASRSGGLTVLSGNPVTAAASTGGNPSADLDQCRNGAFGAAVACTGAAWVNGNAGASNAHWLEGQSIVYRMRFSNLSTAGTHSVTIQWDTTQGGKHALDYVTTFNRSDAAQAGPSEPCSGVSGCNPDVTNAANNQFSIPEDPNVTAGNPPYTGPNAAAGRWNQFFTLYNGTITSVSAYTLSGTYAGNSSTAISITFTAGTANPVLAWGGHIATRADWGTNDSAVAINGSPYHMRLLDLDGSGGNQDRSLSSAAVVFPAILTIIKNAQDGSGNALTTSDSFGFSGTGPSAEGFPATFNLTPDGTNANTQVYNLFLFGSSNQVTITEAAKSGYLLSTNTTLTKCVEQSGGLPDTQNSSMNASTGTATIIAEEAELITCTFTNVRQNASLTVKKHVVNSYGGTAAASAFSLHVKSGTTDVTNSPHAGSETGTLYSLAPGSYVVSEDTPPTGYTQTSITCGATGTENAGGGVTLAAGMSVTCIVTNQDVQPVLRVIKSVTNSVGGTKGPGDFTLHVKANGTDVAGSGAAGLASPGRAYNLNVGTYVVSEDPVSGYTQTGIACGPTGGTLTATTGSVTLASGDDRTCVVSNQDTQPILRVVKAVSNTAGGTLGPGAFTLHVTAGGADVTGSPATGLATPGRAYSLNAGTYVVSEDSVTGYNQTGITCGPTGGTLTTTTGSVTLASGDDKTCIIANADTKASPGLATVQNWTLNDTAVLTSVRSGGGSATITFLLFGPDNPNCVQGGSLPAGAPLFTFTATVDSTESGTVTKATTGGPTVTKQGTYKWWVSYSGNTYNQAQAGSCGNEQVTISPTPAQNQ